MTACLFWVCLLTIWYTYFGYPLLLGIFACLLPRRICYAPQEPAVTLLIAAYNEESSIVSKLENSLLLDYPRDKLQIVVAADGSNDRTCELVRRFADHGVELSYQRARLGKAAAVSHAMRLVRGEIIVFSDANNMYEAGALKALVIPFGDSKIGAVSGAKTVLGGEGALGDSERAYLKYESWIRERETRLGCTIGVSGEIWAIRRELFERPPDTIINDDFYQAMRVLKRGYRMVYMPDAVSFESVAPTIRDEMTRRIRIIAGRYQALSLIARIVPFDRPLITWEVISHKFLRPIVPLAMTIVLVANIAAVIWPLPSGANPLANMAAPWNWVFLELQAVFYLLALLGAYWRTESRVPRLLYLLTFLVNGNLAAMVGLFHFVTGRHSPSWTRVSRRM